MNIKHLKDLRTTLWVVSLVLLSCAGAGAQVDLRRKLPPLSEPKRVERQVERTTPGNTTDMVAFIDDVKTSINRGVFTITFYASPGLVPTVDIGTVAARQQYERWAFPDGESAGQGNAFASQKTGPLSRKVGTSANTFYTFESSMFNIRALEPATTYYYIISIPGGDGAGHHQTTGNFTTPSRKLTVVFESVKIVSDGDPDSPFAADCGEIDLWFWANYGQPSAEFLMIRNLSRGAPVKACSDHVYDINRRFVIENAPNALMLSVSGRDRDTEEIGSDLFEAGSPAPFGGPRDTGDEEQNVAIGEFNLTRFDDGATKRFTLISKGAAGGSEGDLMFEVNGYIKISTPQP